jgi:putative endonuclease
VELIFRNGSIELQMLLKNERKKWSRAKKEAFIRGEFESLQELAKRKSPHPSRRPPAAGSSG